METFLETERLVLRQFTEDDVENLVGLDADPEVMHFMTGGRPTPRHEVESDVLPAFLDYYERFAGMASGQRSRSRAAGSCGGSIHQPWPDRIEGEEEGDVEYALLRSEWEEQTAEEVEPLSASE